MSPVIELSELTAAHGRGAQARRVLAPTTFHIERGESVAVIGRSGAGKSTLAEVVLGLRPPEQGHIVVDGEHWCSHRVRPTRKRRHLVQGVPQDPAAAFVPRWTLRRSIETAVRRLTGEHATERTLHRAAELAFLERELLDRRPTEVSGGQAQRAAIARAIAAGPSVIVADEPTSALDPVTAQGVSTALLALVEQSDIALLLVTHDPAFAERCTRIVTIVPPTT